MKQYVIIGNGIATAGCIEGIRSIDKVSKIVVVSKEKYPVYCRPLISYYLEGKTDLNKISYRSDSFYDDNLCEVIYGVTAEKIDYEKQTVNLSNESELPFSSLCVATGSSPFIPNFEGLDTVQNHFSFMTLDDTLALEKAITPESKVLIIGAGLIGLKCAEGLSNRVANITVCDLANIVLSSILDIDTAKPVSEHLEKNGIDLLMNDSVTKFNGNTAILKSGKTISFDVLVTAVGVRANTSLISEIGGKVNRGIIVNEAMQTSIPHIYAAGDCTEGYDISFENNRVLALLPNAYMGGFTAGVNMAGGSALFDNAIPMNSIGFFGLHIMTAGSYVSEKDGAMVCKEIGDDYYKKFFLKDGTLKGYIIVNDVKNGGIYTNLIRKQTSLDSLDFDILKKYPSYIAFSSENRRKMFGGMV